MKTLMQYGLAGLLTLGMSGTALAYTIDSGATDVGDLDTMIEAANLPNSGQNTETDWVNYVLGTDLTFDVKTETLVATQTDQDADVLAVALQTTDLYYVLKNTTYWALFENVAALDWAVFDTTPAPDGNITVYTYTIDADGNFVVTGTETGLFSDFFNLDSGTTDISHISEFGGGGTVPEPSTVALLGLGLLGLGFARRRKLC